MVMDPNSHVLFVENKTKVHARTWVEKGGSLKIKTENSQNLRQKNKKWSASKRNRGNQQRTIKPVIFYAEGKVGKYTECRYVKARD